MPTHEDGFVKPSYQEGLDESKEVMFACTEALLQKTNTNPLDVCPFNLSLHIIKLSLETFGKHEKLSSCALYADCV